MDCFVFKRRRGAIAFLDKLVLVDFALQGLESLQVESAEVAKDRERSNLLLVAIDKGASFRVRVQRSIA